MLPPYSAAIMVVQVESQATSCQLRAPSHPAIVRSPYATKIGCRKFRSVTRRRDAQPRARLSAPRPTDPAVCRSIDVPESLDRSHVCTSQVTGDPPPRPHSGSRLIRQQEAPPERGLDSGHESSAEKRRNWLRGPDRAGTE